jgi:glycosyl transferase, family 25
MLRNSFRCYFINLDRSVDRRGEIEAELRAVGVEAERVSGFDGGAGYKLDEITYRPWRRNLIGSPLSPGEIGCSESHRRALRQFVESGAPFGVILEDDAILTSDFGQAIESIIADTAGWETVRLEWRKRGVLADPGVRLPGGYNLVVPSNMTFGSTAMLYTRRGAVRALQSLDRGYYQTVDAHFGALCGLGFRYFQLSPPVVSERVGESLIGVRAELSGAGDRKSSKRNPLQLQANSIYRAWLSAWRRFSAQVNAMGLKQAFIALRNAQGGASAARRPAPASDKSPS